MIGRVAARHPAKWERARTVVGTAYIHVSCHVMHVMSCLHGSAAYPQLPESIHEVHSGFSFLSRFAIRPNSSSQQYGFEPEYGMGKQGVACWWHHQHAGKQTRLAWQPALAGGQRNNHQEAGRQRASPVKSCDCCQLWLLGCCMVSCTKCRPAG